MLSMWHHLCQPVCVICTQRYAQCTYIYIVNSLDIFVCVHNVVCPNFLHFWCLDGSWFSLIFGICQLDGYDFKALGGAPLYIFLCR